MQVLLAERPRHISWLKLDFLTLHYIYFIVSPLLLAVVFWAASRNGYQVSFVNSLFLTVSAITEAGLNPVNLSELNTFQQVILWLLIGTGSVPPVTFVLVYVRKRAFEKHYGAVLKDIFFDVENELPCSVLDSETELHQRVRRFSTLSFEAASRLYQEYQALDLLRWLIPTYFLSWQIIGCAGLGAWIAVNSPDTALQNGINPWWDGIFLGVSAFNNSGMSVQDANLTAFKSDAYVLLTIGLLILAGNTCYPVFLRGIIWALWKLLPGQRFRKTRRTLRFLLDHSRDVYTHLFPTRTTWMLLLSVVTLNSIDWVAFEILNLNNPAINTLPLGAKVLDGLIQALAVRFGGFYVVPIASLNIGLLVLYLLMMYISAFPVTMSMRTTNVYDSKVLSPARKVEEGPALLRYLNRKIPGSFSKHMSRQLSHDLWFLSLAVLFIMIIESSSYVDDPITYSVFNVLFEVVSAYGTVGISVGLPGEAYSFCGGWHVLSKLILALVALRGRHRGLPDVIDRAVLMPGVKVGEVPDLKFDGTASTDGSDLETEDVQTSTKGQKVVQEADAASRPRKRRRICEEMV